MLATEALHVPIVLSRQMEDFLLIGEGGSLSSYCLRSCARVSTVSVFTECRVHGVSNCLHHSRRAHSNAEPDVDSTTGPDDRELNDEPSKHAKLLAVYGSKYISLVYLDGKGRLEVHGGSAQLGGWLLDVRWLSADCLAALDAHGRLVRLSTDLTVLACLRCPERCLLYSGALLGSSWPDLVAFCGTVFSQVLVWPATVATPDAGDASEPPVKHRLTGHRGPVFRLALDRSGRTLVSCSDDRSVRRWRVGAAGWCGEQPPTLQYEMFGHEARVWAALPLEDGRTVSVGEDSCVCVWNVGGTLERRWRAHQGASVRALAVSPCGSYLVTGGGDGGVTVWGLDVTPLQAPLAIALPPSLLASSQQAPISPPPTPEDFPRSVCRLSDHEQLVMTNSGRLLLVSLPSDKSAAQALAVFADDRLISYALVAVAPDGRHVALGGLRGELIILRRDASTMCLVSEQRLWQGKVFSLLWLSADSLVACDGDGNLHLMLLDGSGHVSVVRRHQLPSSQQRWISAATMVQHCLVAADREGGLHVFASNQTVPVQSLRRLHGRHGATCLKLRNGCLVSLGRDGTRRLLQPQYTPDGRLRLVQTACDRMPWDWAADECEVDGAPVIVGFHSSELVLWSSPDDRELWGVRCGGGHRSWALCASADRLWLSWVAERRLLHVHCPVSQLRVRTVKPGIQSSDTHCVLALGGAGDGGALLAAAGEDSTIRLVSARRGAPLRPLATLRSHISAVRALCAVDGYLVSAGGRAQIKLWRTDADNCAELSSHLVRGPERRRRADDVPETRFMALEARATPGKHGHYTIAAAGSDGIVRIFVFSTSSPVLTPTRQLTVSGHCLLRLGWLCDHLLVTDSAGAVWRCLLQPGDTEPGAATGDRWHRDTEPGAATGGRWHRLGTPHQSGVNALAAREGSGNGWLLTGGDDGALVVSRLPAAEPASADEAAAVLVTEADLPTAHASQVTGAAWLPDGRLVSASVDQRVCVWQLHSQQLRLQACHLSAVADIKGLCCWQQDGCILLLVHGEGMELLSLRAETPE